jgi:hypothetical protein
MEALRLVLPLVFFFVFFLVDFLDALEHTDRLEPCFFFLERFSLMADKSLMVDKTLPASESIEFDLVFLDLVLGDFLVRTGDFGLLDFLTALEDGSVLPAAPSDLPDASISVLVEASSVISLIRLLALSSILAGSTVLILFANGV